MTLLAAGAAGALLWFAPHFNGSTTGGYWGVIGVIALAGLLLGLSQLHGRDGNPRASFLVAFMPVLLAAGWVILAAQPNGDWVRDHILSWSGEIGIGHAVHNLGEHVVVLAFALGIVFGVTFEPSMARRGRKLASAAPTVALAGAGAQPPLPETASEEPTVVEAAPVAVADGSSAQPHLTDGGWEEPTVVEPAAPQAPEEGAPTVVLAAASPQPDAADPEEEDLLDEGSLEQAPEGSEPGPAEPPL